MRLAAGVPGSWPSRAGRPQYQSRLADPGWREAIGRVHEQVLGRRLPLNGAGVCGAALADLGLPVELLRGFALLARAAGLLGQLAEERRRPIGMQAYMAVDRNAVYVDPTDG